MIKVEALKIWEKICDWKEVCQANEHFSKELLERGSVDFGDSEERLELAYLYCSKGKGYMDMHLKQNLVAFRKYLQDMPASANILLVDYGCGPMTSGLVLAEILSEHGSDWRERTHYHGIDASRNMLTIAERINKEFDELFHDGRFSLAHAKEINLESIRKEKFDVAILSFSYVLAPKTFKLDAKIIEAFPEQWHDAVIGWGCKETHIIYQNPSGDHQKHWSKLREIWPGKQGQIRYEKGCSEDCEWGGPRPSVMARIVGTRE